MKYILSVLLLIINVSCSTQDQDLVTFEVNAGAYDRLDCPVSLDLPTLQNGIGEFQLVEIIKNVRKQLPSQIDVKNNKLWFILDGATSKENSRQFALIATSEKNNTEQIEILKKDGGLQLTFKENPILNYQFEMTYPPKGVDEKFKKSGFLHPVYSPGGEVLTRIQAPDHYHHYGIWGPWTKTHVDGRAVDFWNLGDEQGTVLFKNFLNEAQGDIFSGFTALQEHIDFGATKENRIALNEELEVKIWNLGTEKNSWLVEYTTSIESPLKNGILFDAYRYGGGIGFRATEKWHKDNTSVLTSEGKDRLTADGTSAKWAL